MEFLKYETFTHGFSLEYPKGWTYLENKGFSVALFTPPITSQSAENNMLNLNVSIQDLKAATGSDEIPSPSDFLEISKQQVQQMGAKSLKYGSTKIGSDDETFDGYYMSYQLENEGILAKINQSFFIKDTFTYVITLSVPSGEPSLTEAYERAVKSFRLFTPKGLKYIILDSATGTIKSEDNNLRYNLFAPREWKLTSATTVSSSNTTLPLIYRDTKNNLQLTHSADPLPKSMEPSKFLAHQAQRLRTLSERDSTVDLTKSMKKLIADNLTSSAGNKVEYLRLQSIVKGQEQQLAMIVVDKLVFTTTLTTPAGDMKHWSNILDAILASFKLSDEGSSEDVEPLSYSVFAHLIHSYLFQIPKHFTPSLKFSTNESVMFTSSQSKGEMPVFSATFEDIGSQASQEEYKNLIMHFHNESLEHPKVASDKLTRMDKYKASMVEMFGYDRNVSSDILRAVFKCAVVKRRFGVLLSFRTTKTEFDKLFASTFFAFDSFKLMK